MVVFKKAFGYATRLTCKSFAGSLLVICRAVPKVGLGCLLKAFKTTNEAFQKGKVVSKRLSKPPEKQPCH